MTTTRKYTTYPAYKPSGIPWLGDVPEHWDIQSIKRNTRIYNGATPKSDNPDNWDGEILWGTPEDLGKVSSKYIKDTKRKISEEGYRSCGVTLVPKGSAILSTRAPIGHLALASDSMCFNQGCRGISPTGSIDSNYLFFLLWAAKEELQIRGQGTTFIELGRDALASMPVVLAPIEEQKAIAAYLDQKTAQIDALIEKKEALLHLLAEKRTAMITHAVTKGLNPKSPLKPSGIPWLGDVPEEWGIERLRFSLSTNPARSSLSLTPETTVSFIPMDAVKEWGGLDLSITKPIEEIGSGYTFFSDHDVVIAKITPCFENGKGALAKGLENGTAFGTTELHVMRCKKRLLPEFLFYLTITDLFRKVGEAEMYGAGGQKRVPESFIKDFEIGLPSLGEQKAIAAYLDQKTEEIDAAKSKVEEAIGRLKEYRTALITSAVTGKIKVT